MSTSWYLDSCEAMPQLEAIIRFFLRTGGDSAGQTREYVSDHCIQPSVPPYNSLIDSRTTTMNMAHIWVRVRSLDQRLKYTI